MKQRIKIYIITLILFLIDLGTKLLATNYLLKEKVIIKNFFSLYYSTNTGGAFSLFSSYTIILIIIGLFVLFYLDRNFINDNMKKINKVATVLLMSGVLGNLFDRIMRGYVIDFFRVIFWGWTFPIFNIADIFITIGVILLIIDLIWGNKNEYKSK